MLFIYHILLRLLTPLIPFYLRKRAQRNPEYLQYWNERFGKPYTNPVQQAIWIHAVSVGETRAAAPLIAQLTQHYPQTPILLTQMTPTGRATAQALYPQAQCRYLPYDRADWVAQFLREHQPRFGILMETEIWPNLMRGCLKHQIPLFLANARLSPQSHRGYQRILPLIKNAMQTLSGCFVQTQADAVRLAGIGAKKPFVCGNTKYDITPPTAAQFTAQQWKQLIGNRPIILTASTRQDKEEDEAELLLRAWQSYTGNALLIIVPRHPERFQAAYNTAQQLGYRVQKRSGHQAVQPETQVWIGDSMGEMFAYYQLSDIVFVGGSLVDTGCQNIIEPLSCGKPVIFGYSTYNFQAACEGALAARAAVQVQTPQQWFDTVQQWLQQPQQYQHFSQAAQQFIAQHQGASETIAAHIVRILENKKQ